MDSIGKLISQYGEGDNYTRDQMWYEISRDYCHVLEEQEILPCFPEGDPANQAAINLLVQHMSVIPGIVSEGLNEEALRIVRRLHSLRAPLSSRIAIEYVRQAVEKWLEKSQTNNQ